MEKVPGVLRVIFEPKMIRRAQAGPGSSPGQQLLKDGPDPARVIEDQRAGPSTCRIDSCHQQSWSRSAAASGSGMRFIQDSKNTRRVQAWIMSHSSCSLAGSEVAANPFASGATAMPSASAARRAISWPLHQTLTGYGAYAQP